MASRLRVRLAALASAMVLAVGVARAGVEAPVADAAMRGDATAVRALIKAGADVNAAQGDGMTALHWAAQRGDLEQLKMLLAAGARLDGMTRNGNYTPLHLAARAGALGTVNALLEAGANPNVATTSGGATALHFAAGIGSTDVISALVARGATVDVRDGTFQQTPLMWAAAADRVSAVKLLIAKGASVSLTSKVDDVVGFEKRFVEEVTLRNRKLAAARQLERALARSRLPKDSIAKLDSIARRDSLARRDSVVKDSAAKAFTRDSIARVNPAKAAADKVARARADSIKAARADSIKKAPADSIVARQVTYGELVGGKGGLTPLLFAVRQGNVKTVEALLAAGADINQVSASDHTSPLLMALINGQFDLGAMLLARGADPTLKSDAGNTPLYAIINTQWATKSEYPQPTVQYQQKTNYLDLMEALIAKGADVNARLTKHLWFMSYNFDLVGVNTQGATPFWRASYALDLPAMKLLIKHGADPKIPTTKAKGRFSVDGPDTPDSTGKDPSGLPPVEIGGPAVYPVHAASGVGYGEGFAANSHNHAPDGWMPALKYLVEELGADVNQRDHNGFTPLHHAAARGDNQMIEYLISKGACITAVARKGQTVADMANGPVQRIPPFVETVALLEKLGSKNSHKCKSC
ncbi:MAG: ankyrin repeat domain-containing protein [Gemmatimonadetes bacterium]|nr:ankyrin repeat domain-containing protein [Gemmatimonadota bacterium]